MIYTFCNFHAAERETHQEERARTARSTVMAIQQPYKPRPRPVIGPVSRDMERNGSVSENSPRAM